MTTQQIELLKLGITPIDDRLVLTIESGLEWVKTNTTLEFDMNNDEDLKNLPSCVKFFLIKFVEINRKNAGVSSQSIEGLSQSFKGDKTGDLIWDSAESLLGDLLKSRIKFVIAQKRWRA